MYYLTGARQTTCFNGDRFIESYILKKSPDISKLQKILHEAYKECCDDSCIMALNEAERDMNFFIEGPFDELCNEEQYDKDDKLDGGHYIMTTWTRVENDKDEDYMVAGLTMTKWFQFPEEIENVLSYRELHGDDIVHVMLRIVSEDDIPTATDE